MRFEDLQPGDRFTIDENWYEAYLKGDRVILAYVMRETEYRGYCDEIIPDLERINQPGDLVGDQFVIDAFSDLRFNLNNLTAFERQCDEELKSLL